MERTSTKWLWLVLLQKGQALRGLNSAEAGFEGIEVRKKETRVMRCAAYQESEGETGGHCSESRRVMGWRCSGGLR